ncbi:MAG: DsbA family protein [Gammaproteobacteria bacterium]
MKKFTTMIAILALIASPLALAQPQPMSPEQTKQIEQVVHSYLVKNPQVIVESLQTLQQQQMDQAKKAVQKTQENAPKFADALFHQANDPVAGNVNGKVTVVDFFDYQCPHCTHMTPILEAVIAANPNLRVVFKEFPIRGALSEFASKAALAANAQGKYFEFHKALMKQAIDKSPLTEDAILQVAKSVGLDMTKLKADMNSDAVSKQIKDTYKLAQSLQLMGTPAFFIAKSDVTSNAKPTAIVFIPGQVDQAKLKDTIDKVSNS